MTPNTYEGRWICAHCGAENLGRFEQCNGHGNDGCGTSRPTGVRFYLPEDSPVVTDRAQLDDATSGADWHCDHCDGANKNAIGGHRVQRCVHCGNGRDTQDADTPVRHFAEHEVLRDGEAARATQRADLLASTRARTAQRQKALDAADPGNAGPTVVVWGIGALIAGLVAFLVWFFFIATSFTDGRVTATQWSWTQSLQERVILHDEGFHSPPRNATVLFSEERKNGMKDVQVGTKEETYATTKSIPGTPEPYNCGKTDMGNGYFQDKICYRSTTIQVPAVGTRTVPVMKRVPNMETWRRWSYPEWIHVETLRSSGSTKIPTPPTLPKPGHDERLTSPDVVQTVTLTLDDGTVLRMSHDPALWEQADTGEAVRVERNRAGSIQSVEILD